MSRTAIAILSTENLLHNLQVIKSAAPKAKIIAMVKANAYGHGIRSVGMRLDAHTDMLGVASIDEALALRNVGVKTQIMLAQGIFEPNELITAAAEKFHVVFHNQAQLEWLEKTNLPSPLNCWLKINTGMGRLGLPLAKAKKYYDKLQNHHSVEKPIRIMSHFACSDEIDHPLNQEQISNFENFIKGTETEYSFCNSAAIFNFPEQHYDYVRTGIALYGISPIASKSASELGLKPVMTLQTSLMSVQNMSKGSNIGYSARYNCPEDMPVGIIAFGYGDGYPIGAKDGTPILVNNSECKLIGRPSMDMIAVDLRNCPDAKVGDPVTLWGEGLPIERVAEYMPGNITYNMLTAIQNRVKFIWTKVL